MTDKKSLDDQHTLLGIAFADQSLIAAHLAMFAAKTNNAHETLTLLHDIATEIASRYQLPEVAQQTMTQRMEKTIHLATAIITQQTGSTKKTH